MTTVIAKDLIKDYRYGFNDGDQFVLRPPKGLSPEVVTNISRRKQEPEWMLDFRLKALGHFLKRPMPTWGPDLSGIDFDDIYYYVRPAEEQGRTWADVPEGIKRTFDRLGIPEAERKFLGGVSAQYECLRGSTQVWTTTGMHPIADLTPGEQVFAFNEDSSQLEVATVLAQGESGQKEILAITALGRTIGASGNHPLLSLRDERSPASQRAHYVARWIPAAQLAPGDLIAIATDVPEYGEPAPLQLPEGTTSSMLPTTTSDDLCWFLGAYLGDGYLHHRHQYVAVEIAVDHTDTTLVQELQRVGLELFGLQFNLSKDELRLTAKGTAKLAQYLELNGLGGTAHTKRLPAWVYGLPASQRLAVLAGFLDTDGYVRNHPTSKDAMYCSANQALLNDFKQLLSLCGIGGSQVIPVSNRHPFDPQRTLPAYHLRLSGRFDRIPVRSPRRIARMHQRQYSHSYRTAAGTVFPAHTSPMLGFVKIDKIEPLGVETVYDLEISGHHNFVADGFVVHNSEVVYHSIRKDLEKLGVLFSDCDTGLREHPEIFRKYFATVVPPNDNKFAALNSAVWSGGSFVYVPKGVKVDIPLQAYFRINTESMGQFERTLIIAEEGSSVHYVEGCLPAGEIIALSDGSFRPIEKVRVGNHVINHQGHSDRVQAISVREYAGEMVTVTPVSPMNQFRVTVEHPVLAIKRRAYKNRDSRHGLMYEVSSSQLRHAQPTWIPAQDLEVGDFIVFPRYHPPVSQELLHPDFMTLAGYYTADGSASVSNGYKVLTFSVHQDDQYAISEIRRCSQSLFGTPGSISIHPEKHEAVLQLFTAAGHDAMKTHCGAGSKFKALSPLMMTQPTALLELWLNAYVHRDGNTTIHNHKQWFRLSSVSPTLVRQVQQVLSRLGVYATARLERAATTRTILGRTAQCANLYQIQWTLPASKNRLARTTDDYFLVPIRRLDKQLVQCPVYNLQVANQPSYLASGFAVHNCTAPTYSKDSLHSAVVEIIALPGATVRYTTIQNWSNNVYNLVTKRAVAHRNASVFWIDGNLGSKVTAKYPSVYLMGEGAHGEILSVAFAGDGQHQDAGGKVIHVAPHTTSSIVSKSVSKGTGRTSYRGHLKVYPKAQGVRSSVRCDALLLDETSRSDTYPYMDVEAEDVEIGHEASVSKIGDEQLFYLRSRGISEVEATALIVNGFIEPFVKELPMEYALELNRLIALQMEGSVG